MSAVQRLAKAPVRSAGGEALSVQKSFPFTSSSESFGFVNVGAKICEIVKDSLAQDIGVQPGWHIASIDGIDLNGAATGLRRTIPSVTTDEVHHILKQRREIAASSGVPLEILFWTQATPHRVEYEDIVPLEAHSVEELKAILIAKYGSIVQAWTEVLDTSGDGQLDYKEFLAACRIIGFEGSLKKVYRELDKDGSGQISLNELDPTFQMDFSKGRCAICTLLNPCDKHTAKEQKTYLLAMREAIMAGKAPAEAFSNSTPKADGSLSRSQTKMMELANGTA
eukprot:gnl/MRDRNA2_/MRDRNA2_103300_c0_seq1.p1 gnl/MRDRNA2_/MRDRNA2_103300_c0~~gnl/MRDRNA2_/MRDRNA2_103300_c0_seq1.p1  ORF type:complete len:298 (-),score=60.31 gnl/MRDRNA2_/MRDRNA2_103300_c0_seq1:38-880(-)